MAWSLNSRQRRGITARPGHTIPTSWDPTLHDSTRDCRNLRKTVEFGKATSEYPVHFTFEPPLCLSGSDASRWATDGKRKVRLTWHAYHPCGSRNQKKPSQHKKKTPPLTSFQSVGPNHCYLNSRVISNDFVIADKLWSKLRLIQKQECQSGSLSSQWPYTWSRSGSSMVYSVKTTTPVQLHSGTNHRWTVVPETIAVSRTVLGRQERFHSALAMSGWPDMELKHPDCWRQCNPAPVEVSNFALQDSSRHITKGCRIGYQKYHQERWLW